MSRSRAIAIAKTRQQHVRNVMLLSFALFAPVLLLLLISP